MNTDISLVFCTFPQEEDVLRISKEMIKKRLCACASMFNIKSIYTWKDNIENQSELQVIFKTRKTLVKELVKELQQLHPYEVPEIIELSTNSVSDTYLSWINDVTAK